jgi:hypothetical protein
MKRLFLCAILGALGMAPAMFADVIDYMLNINGTTYCPSGTGATCSSTAGLGGAPGVTSTLDTSFDPTGNNTPPYGLGTVNLTYNPGPGTYNVDLWLFEELVPNSGYDEYGTTGGSSLGAGESWQIDVPDYDYNAVTDPNFGGLPSGAGSIIANTAANTLSDTNYVPGTTDSFLNLCTGSTTCNDYTSMALGENFTLGAGQEELVSFTVSTTAPATGFYLEQIDPGITGTSATYYYSVTATPISVCTSVGGNDGCNPTPEPSSLIPLLGLAGILWFAVRRRSATA